MRVDLRVDSVVLESMSRLTIEFKFRVSTYNIRALTYNIKEFL